MIPLPELGVEFILGIAAALFAANLWVLLRPAIGPREGRRPSPRPASSSRVVLNMVIGGLVAAWALATLLAR